MSDSINTTHVVIVHAHLLYDLCLGLFRATCMWHFVRDCAILYRSHPQHSLVFTCSADITVQTFAAPGGAAALIISVMEPFQFLKRFGTADALLSPITLSWCIRPSLEPTLQERFMHGLLLSLATMLGSFILFTIALVTNNVGPSSKRYPTYWWS